MPFQSIVTSDEYGIDGLTLVLEVFFGPVCKVTGSGSVEGRWCYHQSASDVYMVKPKCHLTV